MNPISEAYAWVKDQDLTYFASEKLIEGAPSTAVVRLIQGVYAKFPQQARRILRNRIFTNQPHLLPVCHGMVRVAAKRATPSVELPLSLDYEVSNWQDLRPRSIESSELPRPSSSWTNQNFIEVANQIAKNAHRQESLYLSDRPVGAVLVQWDTLNGSPKILMGAVNSNALNRTFHAEVNLIQEYYRLTTTRIPPNCTLFTSLKPCRMCAAMIWHCASDLKSLKVIYSEDDPGSNAKNTILSPGTFDRMTFAKTQFERELTIESQYRSE